MNAEIKRKWVAALRSGEYRQAKDYLARTNDDGQVVGYCCLGVLCEIAVQEEAIAPPSPINYEGSLWYDGDDVVLPESVAAWAGLDSEDPAVPRPEGAREHPSFLSRGEDKTTLASLNDGGFTFAQIADLIEEHL